MRLYKKTPYVESESGIQTACNNHLSAKGFYVIRINSGSIPTTGKNGKQYRIKMADAGTPDTIAFKRFGKLMLLLFVEYKRPGNKPTKLQDFKMIELKERGAFVFVIHSFEEMQEKLSQVEQEINGYLSSFSLQA